ncbi:MAG: Abi family protein [Methanobacteriaceae archaeon]|nr:Abi family protein [Methanobacteriaceae archaeon]
MYNKGHKDVDGLIKIFKDRGMLIGDVEKAKRTLSHINYYKIKEFAEPFFRNETYTNISFEDVIARFYLDKRLRVHLLHSIEDIELSFKTKFAYVLGKRYGAFGYLDFKNWCNKKEFCRHYINDKEREMKKYIKRLINRDGNMIIKKFFLENQDCEYPPIWMLIEILSFGEVLKFYELMSNKNKEEIADYYNAQPNELESWLKALKYIRNLSAHNTNVIDSKILTKASIKNEWKNFLYIHPKNNKPTDRIAVPIIIIIYMLKRINPNYKIWKLKEVFKNLFKDSDYTANKYGFASKNLSIFERKFEI